MCMCIFVEWTKRCRWTRINRWCVGIVVIDFEDNTRVWHMTYDLNTCYNDFVLLVSSCWTVIAGRTASTFILSPYIFWQVHIHRKPDQQPYHNFTLDPLKYFTINNRSVSVDETIFDVTVLDEKIVYFYLLILWVVVFLPESMADNGQFRSGITVPFYLTMWYSVRTYLFLMWHVSS